MFKSIFGKLTEFRRSLVNVPQLVESTVWVRTGKRDCYNGLAERGYQLVAAQVDANPGSGHRHQSPARLRGIALWGSAFGRAVYRCRVGIEGAFGNATSSARGLGPLPAWVRRLGRVPRWVWAKRVINAARIHRRRQRLAAPLQ